ncbi:hypothetical protein CWN85_08695 [Vibrio splendidus]|uniref:hypothetical protein n=1 Tax=Vibrio splendidus TaxID=29497 RepID=UPI000D3ABB3C|nr:hypothetical protein [Vibrio splendidus]PTP02659.1 hypothetical protein CWN86_19935 [Vibrio splendidus]PTP24150.1 hypothetical protein CWN85_08695 [Vibrio splendidus]
MSAQTYTDVTFNLPTVAKEVLAKMEAESLNEFRSKNDFPVIVDFLFHYLPHFQRWIDSQKHVTYERLIEHGPARFLRTSKLAYIYEQKNGETHTFKSVYNLVKGEHKTGNSQGRYFYFTPYFSWVKKHYSIDTVRIEEALKPYNYAGSKIVVKSEVSLLKDCQLTLELRDLSQITFNGAHCNLEFSNLTKSVLDISQCTVIWYSHAVGLTLVRSGAYHTIYKTVFGSGYLFDDRKINIVGGNFQFIAIVDSPIKVVLKDASIEHCLMWDDHLYIYLDNGIIRNCNFDHSYMTYKKRKERAELHLRMKELYSGIGKVANAGRHHYKMKSEIMLSLLNPRKHDYVKYSQKSLWQKTIYHLKCYGSLANNALSKVFWGFGEKPWRIWLTSCSLNIVLACVYYYSKGSATYEKLPNSISYSLYSFVNINKPTLNHTEAWLDVLSSAQGFMGLLCIGIFISALVSKVKEY